MLAVGTPLTCETSMVTAPTQVIGTVQDPNLVSYTLSVAPIGSDNFTTFFTGLLASRPTDFSVAHEAAPLMSTSVPPPRTQSLSRATNGSPSDDPSSKPAFIDRMIEESWKKAGVKPARPATDDEFLRRAYLDLLGRIPNVQEARAFLQTREKDKRDKLVTYLLEHPDFAKNFAAQWSVLLIGRGNQGRMVDRAALTSWLRKQFASDRPWNEIVHELVSSTGSNKDNGAVNYVLAHLELEAVPLTSRTTRLFLGKQIQCTQCHDHPSNDWKQLDFWGINAFFRGIKTQQVRKPDATGLEVLDHVELRDVPSDDYVRFDKRNGLVGVAFPRFLDGKKISQGKDVIRRAELGVNDALRKVILGNGDLTYRLFGECFLEAATIAQAQAENHRQAAASFLVAVGIFCGQRHRGGAARGHAGR